MFYGTPEAHAIIKCQLELNFITGTESVQRFISAFDFFLLHDNSFKEINLD